MIKNIIYDNEFGCVFNIDHIPNSMFNFYVVKKRAYKDGSFQWNLCVENSLDNNKYFVLDRVRGSKQYAISCLEKIIHQYENY